MAAERRERFVQAPGARIHVVEEGPSDGPPVVFLHGFPELWWSWRHQLRALGEAGWRAVAVDLRGFGDSDAPEDVWEYALPALAEDVSAVIDSVGGRAALVSHDWGGVLGWAYASLFPDRVDRLVVLNAPHPNTYADVAHHLPQLRKSWYIFFFQFEGVAEEAMLAGGGDLLRSWWYDTARVKLPEEDVARYLEAFRRPGRLRAGLNWYRANVPPAAWFGERTALPPVACPSMLLWGLDDPYLDFELGRRSGEHVDGPFALEAFPDTGHWLQQERPDEVNDRLLDFLGASF